MFRRARFVVVTAFVALLAIAAPAYSEECVEVAQWRHCFDA